MSKFLKKNSNVFLVRSTLFVFVFFTLYISLFAIVAHAQSTVTTPGDNTGNTVTTPGKGISTVTLQNPLKVKSIGELLDAVLQYVTYLAVLFAVLVLIWIGFKFIAARGDSKKISDAVNWLQYALIGIALILGARLIISIALNTLKSTGVVNKETINSANQALNGSSNDYGGEMSI